MTTVTVKITNTATTIWQVPIDFGSMASVECIGGGGSGAVGAGQGSGSGNTSGGGGGGYSKSLGSDLSGITFTIGNNISIQVGAGGTGVNQATTGLANGNAGTDTWFNSAAPSLSTGVLAKGGGAGQSASGTTVANGGTGGASASGIGSTKFSGGAGGVANSGTGRKATGGGGAGGTTANGSTAPANSTSNTSTAGGAGGTASGGSAGALGGGAGGNGTVFGGTDGAGGGGGGNEATTGTLIGGAGGNWGAGGGACITGTSNQTSGAGSHGIIVIIYNQAVTGALFRVPDLDGIGGGGPFFGDPLV